MRARVAETAIVANITGNAEATMNTAACKSVGLVLLELQRKYHPSRCKWHVTLSFRCSK
ncbi:MAG: hypothetical protein P1U40_00625 [Coxiellaceae bacterium]|nr:hypothetical protein [Coxiellaceae bacterium]